jgi:hypothetical protein
LALGKFDEAELGFLQEYIMAKLPGEKNSEVRLCYLVALANMTDDDSNYAELITELNNQPDILASFKDRNLMLYSMTIDAIESGCISGNLESLKFVYSHLYMDTYKAAFSGKLQDMFTKSFVPSLKALDKLDLKSLKMVLSFLCINKEIDDINYLRLEYYYLNKSKDYADISKKILDYTKCS